MTRTIFSYQDYILACIDAASSHGRSGIAGLTTIPGFTSSGKTSSLFENYKNALCTFQAIKERGYQSVFICHRLNILLETARGCQKNKVPFSFLYNRRQQVMSTFGKLKLEFNDTASLNPKIELENLKGAEILENAEYRKILQLTKSLETTKEEEQQDELCKKIERLLALPLKRLRNKLRDIDTTEDNYQAIKCLDQIDRYRKNPLIQHVLPAIIWSDQLQPVLFMTSQKFFLGFHDGGQYTRGPSWSHRSCVIFMDEADAQQKCWLSLLAERQLQHPLHHLVHKIIKGTTVTRPQLWTHNNLPSPIQTAISNTVEHITSAYERLKENTGIDLMECSMLIRSPIPPGPRDSSRPPPFLFKAGYQIIKPMIKLSQELQPDNYQICVALGEEARTQTTDPRITLGKFYSELKFFILDLGYTLNEQLPPELIYDGRPVRDDFFEGIFAADVTPGTDGENDHLPGYAQELKYHLHVADRSVLKELAQCEQMGVIPHLHSCLKGISCWLIKNKRGVSQQAMHIRQAQLQGTPESTLIQIGSHHLVFSMSATINIPRVMGNFDLYTSRRALQEIAIHRQDNENENDRQKPIPFIPDRHLEQQMFQTIQDLRQLKQEQRQTRVITEITDLEHRVDALDPALNFHLPESFFLKDEETLTVLPKVIKYRKSTLKKLLGALTCFSEHSNHRGQIIFCNSFRYLKLWLIGDNAKGSRSLCPWLEIEPESSVQDPCQQEKHLFTLSTRYNEQWLPVQLSGHPFLLFFLNSETQKIDNFPRIYQSLFKTGRPVILITQTASSSTGINLDFYDFIKLIRRDISLMCIVELPHFFFAAVSSTNGSDALSNAAVNLFNLSQLRLSGHFSKSCQERLIIPIMENNKREIQQLNKQYKSTDDFTLSNNADIIQILGRMWRQWTSQPLPDQVILNDDVAASMHRFTQLPNGYHACKQTLSDLICDVYDRIERHPPTHLARILSARRHDPAIIHRLIDHHFVNVHFPAARLSTTSHEYAQKVGKQWRKLRTAVLCYDLACPLSSLIVDSTDPELPGKLTLQQWAFINPQVEYEYGTPLYYHPKEQRILSKPAPGFLPYHPENCYEPVKLNPLISSHFLSHDFRLTAQPGSHEEESLLMHPDIHQRILLGAIGEEGIMALLYNGFGITCQHQPVNPYSLEFYDFAPVNSRVRIDAKNFSSNSIGQMQQSYLDWLDNTGDFDPPEKLNRIRANEGSQTQLAILNLRSPSSDAHLDLRDSKMNAVTDIHDADLIFLEGCLKPDCTEMTSGFQAFCNYLTA